MAAGATVNVFEAVAFVIAVLCIASVVILERVLGAMRGNRRATLEQAEQRAQDLLLRVSELERHNDELRQQLEWTRRLMEAQDRLLRQLEAPTTPRV